MNLTVILVIILTTVLFVLNYRMLQMKKNVTNIVDQIVAAHSAIKTSRTRNSCTTTNPTATSGSPLWSRCSGNPSR